jgi:hypothetical protein
MYPSSTSGARRNRERRPTSAPHPRQAGRATRPPRLMTMIHGAERRPQRSYHAEAVACALGCATCGARFALSQAWTPRTVASSQPSSPSRGRFSCSDAVRPGSPSDTPLSSSSQPSRVTRAAGRRHERDGLRAKPSVSSPERPSSKSRVLNSDAVASRPDSSPASSPASASTWTDYVGPVRVVASRATLSRGTKLRAAFAVRASAQPVKRDDARSDGRWG